MNHIYAIRLVVLKRPVFQSQSYDMAMNEDVKNRAVHFDFRWQRYPGFLSLSFCHPDAIVGCARLGFQK